MMQFGMPTLIENKTLEDNINLNIADFNRLVSDAYLETVRHSIEVTKALLPLRDFGNSRAPTQARVTETVKYPACNKREFPSVTDSILHLLLLTPEAQPIHHIILRASPRFLPVRLKAFLALQDLFLWKDRQEVHLSRNLLLPALQFHPHIF